MENHPPFTLGAVYSHWRSKRLHEELRTDWTHAVFYRPLSLAIGFLLARYTAVSPMAVTLFGGLSIPAMAAVSVGGNPSSAVPIIAVLAYVGGLVDCIDGDLARQSGTSSRLGGYVDFQIDMARWATLYAAVGIALDRVSDAGYPLWTMLAALAAWMRMFARSSRDFRRADEAARPAAAVSCRSQVGSSVPLRLCIAFFDGIDGAIPIVLFAGWWGGAGGSIMFFPLALACLDVVHTQISNVGYFKR